MADTPDGFSVTFGTGRLASGGRREASEHFWQINTALLKGIFGEKLFSTVAEPAWLVAMVDETSAGDPFLDGVRVFESFEALVVHCRDVAESPWWSHPDLGFDLNEEQPRMKTLRWDGDQDTLNTRDEDYWLSPESTEESIAEAFHAC